MSRKVAEIKLKHGEKIFDKKRRDAMIKNR